MSDQFDERLVGAIASIKLAQSQKMLTDEHALTLIDCIMKTHGIPSDNVTIAKTILNSSQLKEYINEICNACKPK